MSSAKVMPDESPPEEVKIQIPRPMKIMDKIVDYQQKQQQQRKQQQQEPSSSPPPLPAVSLEFFPPKSPDGVLVSPFGTVAVFIFQFG
jgi:hypothetical protein